jgi:hypothetical protein
LQYSHPPPLSDNDPLFYHATCTNSTKTPTF